MNALEMIDGFNAWLAYQYADRELDDKFYAAFDKAMEMIQDNPEYWASLDNPTIWKRARDNS